MVEEQEVVTELIRKCIAQNATDALDQEDYARRYAALMDRYEAAAAQLAELNEKKQAREDQASMIGGFLFELRERDEALSEFDPYIWAITLDVVTANSDGSLVFRFRNGLEVTAYNQHNMAIGKRCDMYPQYWTSSIGGTYHTACHFLAQTAASEAMTSNWSPKELPISGSH